MHTTNKNVSDIYIKACSGLSTGAAIDLLVKEFGLPVGDAKELVVFMRDTKLVQFSDGTVA